MRARGIDIARPALQAPRASSPGERFDYVIRLCDRVREVCPEFPGGPELIHWSIPDPAREPGRDEETLPAFERMADRARDPRSASCSSDRTTTSSQEVT